MIRSWVDSDRYGCIGKLSTRVLPPRRRAVHLSRGALPVGHLLVERDGVVHGGRDPVFLQRCSHRTAIGAFDGELGPGRPATSETHGGPDHIAQTFRVAGGHGIPQAELFLEHGEFGQQDRRLHRVEPAIDPDTDVVVLVAPLAMHAERTENWGEGIVGDEHGTAIAVAAQRFGREEAGGRNRGQCAHARAPTRSAETSAPASARSHRSCCSATSFSCWSWRAARRCRRR